MNRAPAGLPAPSTALARVVSAPGLLARYGAPAAKVLGAGAVLYSGYKGLQNAAESQARSQDYMQNMRRNLSSPLPDLTVKASYAKFAREKLGFSIPQTLQEAALKGVGGAIAEKLIGGPVDALHQAVKSRFFDEPKMQKNFDEVVKGDPMLAQAHGSDPDMLPLAFSTIKRFSPSLASDRLATRSLLRHVAMSGGEMDFGTMKMLAETEKMHREGKGK